MIAASNKSVTYKSNHLVEAETMWKRLEFPVEALKTGIAVMYDFTIAKFAMQI